MIGTADRITSLGETGGDVVGRAKDRIVSKESSDNVVAKITRTAVLIIATIGTTVVVLTYLRKDMREDMAASYYGKSDGDVLKTRVDNIDASQAAILRAMEKFGDQQQSANDQLIRATNASATLAIDVNRVQVAQKELQDGMAVLTRELLQLKASNTNTSK